MKAKTDTHTHGSTAELFIEVPRWTKARATRAYHTRVSCNASICIYIPYTLAAFPQKRLDGRTPAKISPGGGGGRYYCAPKPFQTAPPVMRDLWMLYYAHTAIHYISILSIRIHVYTTMYIVSSITMSDWIFVCNRGYAMMMMMIIEQQEVISDRIYVARMYNWKSMLTHGLSRYGETRARATCVYYTYTHTIVHSSLFVITRFDQQLPVLYRSSV